MNASLAIEPRYPTSAGEAPERFDRIEIRPIQRDDRHAFDGFYERCFDAEYRAVLDPASHARVLAWARSSAIDEMLYEEHDDWGEPLTAIGAFAGDRPLGTIVYSDAITYTLVSGLYVEPDWKRAGIGSALMSHVVDGILLADDIALWVMDGSPEARRFYESIGFVQRAHEVIEEFDGTVEVGSSLMVARLAECAARLGVLYRG